MKRKGNTFLSVNLAYLSGLRAATMPGLREGSGVWWALSATGVHRLQRTSMVYPVAVINLCYVIGLPRKSWEIQARWLGDHALRSTDIKPLFAGLLSIFCHQAIAENLTTEYDKVKNISDERYDGEENGCLTCVANATLIIIMKSAAIHSRIDPETKEKAEIILNRLGMSHTEAIRMFYTQITLRNGLPFTVEIPNEETERALEDSRAGHDLERFENADALIDSWK